MLMKVLLSIKPEFANKIFDGSKKFEYRRVMPKEKGIKKIVVYASAPISKVIGEVNVEAILSDSVETLWDLTKDFSGISYGYYREYFEGKDHASAFKLKKATRYKDPVSLESTYGVRPPQSFMYIN